MKIDSMESRCDLLIQAIFKKYGAMTPDQVDIILSSYQNAITDMFEITGVKKTFVELTNLFHDDEIYRPVEVDDSILPYLKRREAFFMTLGLAYCLYEPAVQLASLAACGTFYSVRSTMCMVQFKSCK